MLSKILKILSSVASLVDIFVTAFKKEQITTEVIQEVQLQEDTLGLAEEIKANEIYSEPTPDNKHAILSGM